MAVSTSNILKPDDFLMSQGANLGGRAETLDGLPLGGRSLESIEEAAIRQTLERFGGNKTKTAKALGIATSTLYEKLKKFE
jgi:DNA-binding NtrC family response regulator